MCIVVVAQEEPETKVGITNRPLVHGELRWEIMQYLIYTLIMQYLIYILLLGYAHTFLNADQGRYAGHLIQALEFSECPIPAQLKILWEEYVTARKAEGKDVSCSLFLCLAYRHSSMFSVIA